MPKKKKSKKKKVKKNIILLKKKKYNVNGPFAADTIFLKNNRKNN